MTTTSLFAAALLVGGSQSAVAATDPAIAGSEPQVASGAAQKPPDAQVPTPAQVAPPAPASAPDPATPNAPGGEIVVMARPEPPPGDPAERINAASFKVVQGVDMAIVGPLATGYEKATPKPVRKGLHNLLNNLSEPINALNFLLQLKPGKAVKTVGRFAINSTIGIGGLIDVAAKKPFKLPYARNGFANTFGYYGIKQGPYMYLPLIGPTTLRDLTGRLLDLSLVPRLVGRPFDSTAYAAGTGVVRSLDERVGIDGFLNHMRKECDDPYAAERDYYLVLREAEIEALHGRETDVRSRLPACLVNGPMVQLGQASPPSGRAAPAPEEVQLPTPPAEQVPVSPAAPEAPPPPDQAASAATI